MQRVSTESIALPASVPRRDRREEPAPDITERVVERRASPNQPIEPRIVSTAHGPIRELMLWYPPGIPDSPAHRAIYADLLRTLPEAAKVILVVHPDSQADAVTLANAEPSREVEIVEAPDWLAFSIWAEDACIVVDDIGADPPVTYFIEPLEFPRVGDSLIAENVARATDLETSQLPLIFQGGNVLIGDTFVLIGRDYLADSIDKAIEIGAIEGFPLDGTRAKQETFVKALFRRLFDPSRVIHFLGGRPASRTGNWVDVVDGRKVGHDVERGSGAEQPIFHIDMFVSLAGRDSKTGNYRVLVGDPGLADKLLGLDRLPFDKQKEFDQIASQLKTLGFDVRRTPLPLVATRSGASEIQVKGKAVAVDDVEEWYHPTSSNCLVQIDQNGNEVWLPTYGYGTFSELKVVDAAHKKIWTDLGFKVHQLGDFHQFAMALGALHCIKKYLRR